MFKFCAIKFRFVGIQWTVLLIPFPRDAVVINAIAIQQNQIIRKDFYLKQRTYPAEPVFVTDEKYAEGVFDITLSSSAFKALPSLGEADVLRIVQSVPGVAVTSDYSAQLY